MIDWNEIPKYRRFINGAYQASEIIAQKYRLALSGRFRAYLEDAAQLALLYAKGRDTSVQVERLADRAALEMTRLQQNLSDRAGKLGYVAQSKAMTATDSSLHPKRYRDRKPFNLSRTHKLTKLALMRQFRKMQDCADRVLIDGADIQKIMRAIEEGLPPKRAYRRPVKSLYRIKEATREFEGLNASAYISQEEWDAIVDDYLRDEIVIDRSPSGVVFEDPYDASEDVYQWQVEKDITHIFVDSIRKGEIQSFKDAGVVDMLFLAVIDDKTDDCCFWRNGKTITEIERMIEDGDSPDDDECQDQLEPPLHFNCRCRIVPATEELTEPEDESLPLFDEWMRQK